MLPGLKDGFFGTFTQKDLLLSKIVLSQMRLKYECYCHILNTLFDNFHAIAIAKGSKICHSDENWFSVVFVTDSMLK